MIVLQCINTLITELLYRVVTISSISWIVLYIGVAYSFPALWWVLKEEGWSTLGNKKGHQQLEYMLTEVIFVCIVSLV